MQKSLFHTYEVWKFVFHPVFFHITVVLVLHICCNYTTLGVSEELELLMYTFLGAAGREGGLKKVLILFYNKQKITLLILSHFF